MDGNLQGLEIPTRTEERGEASLHMTLYAPFNVPVAGAFVQMQFQPALPPILMRACGSFGRQPVLGVYRCPLILREEPKRQTPLHLKRECPLCVGLPPPILRRDGDQAKLSEPVDELPTLRGERDGESCFGAWGWALPESAMPGEVGEIIALRAPNMAGLSQGGSAKPPRSQKAPTKEL